MKKNIIALVVASTVLLLSACGDVEKEANAETPTNQSKATEVVNTKAEDKEEVELIENTSTDQSNKELDDFVAIYADKADRFDKALNLSGQMIDNYMNNNSYHPPVIDTNTLIAEYLEVYKALDELKAVEPPSDLVDLHVLGINYHNDFSESVASVLQWYSEEDDSLMYDALEYRQSGIEKYNEFMEELEKVRAAK